MILRRFLSIKAADRKYFWIILDLNVSTGLFDDWNLLSYYLLSPKRGIVLYGRVLLDPCAVMRSCACAYANVRVLDICKTAPLRPIATAVSARRKLWGSNIPEILVKLKHFTFNLCELLRRFHLQWRSTIRLFSRLDLNFVKIVRILLGVSLNKNWVNLSPTLLIEEAFLKLIEVIQNTFSIERWNCLIDEYSTLRAAI